MKRLIAFLLAAVTALAAASCSSWDWSLHYDKTCKAGGFDFGLDTGGKQAFAAAYGWDGTDEGRRIVIPDEVEDCTVFKLGGFYGRGLPMPFYVAVPSDPEESFVPAGEEGGPRKEEILFTLVFGPNLTEIANVRESGDFIAYAEDGTPVLYHPVFAFEVDGKNPAFYAKDGKLYRKRGGALVTDFEYPAEK